MSERSTSDLALRRRLRPLHLAVALQGFLLWVPVEKLFMTELGFDAADVGLLAAAYAAVVPVLEVPSGVLADRWSRRGVLALAAGGLAGSAALGALSTGVGFYIASAMVLGLYFAMYSGTLEAVIYDTVLEETGSSDQFQNRFGHARMIESAAQVSGALVGGWLASLTSVRLTYVLTVPFGVLAMLALLRFREPKLHQAGEPAALSQHLALTVRTLFQGRRLLPIVILMIISAVLLQSMIEFGPLWLVAMAVPAALYGPYWAGLVSSLGFGGLLAGRLQPERRAHAVLVAVLLVAAAWVVTTSAHALVVTAAHIVIALLAVLAGISAAAQLHDAVPSTLRTGVTSGVGALSSLVFLPFALVFGRFANNRGVHDAGWMIVASTALAGVLIVCLAGSDRSRR